MSAKKVHFIGIGGVGMAALAVLVRSRGDEVTGCDRGESARTRWLGGLGVPVACGHDPAHLEGVDEVVVTPAVPADEPELVEARRRAAAGALRVRMRGEVLAEAVNAAADSIAVCGSHGKTTTSTWIARLLTALGERVSWAIGGETGAFPVAGATPGDGPGVLVVEADESDGTLALYRAKTLVVTNCEYDHPDHFKTPEDYRRCYAAAEAQSGLVLSGEALGELDAFPSLAPHNRRNARLAYEVAVRRGHAPDRVLAALAQVVRELPDRRFQTVWPETRDLPAAVVTDYAHHPTEMRCAVGMARRICRGTLRVLFQPHRYTRTRALIADFPDAFPGADEVVLCPTYAAFEPPLEGGGAADLYAACRARFAARSARGEAVPRLYLARSCAEAWEHARNSRTEGDLTLLLGAGDIIRLVPQVRADLASPAAPGASRRRIWIGQGSNTWKSDLDLGVEYVKTSGSAGAPGASLGIPWMAGIPGTIGGWVKMNAGAFGHSISEVVRRVKVDGRWLDRAACGFAYRHSDIEGEIQDVEFEPLDPVRRGATAEEFLARRRKFPAGTWGSVFKNPPGDFAGRILEACGAKGLRVGGARVWEEHANVIVSGPDATPSDVLALAQILRARALLRTGVALESEVQGLAF